MGLTSRFKIYVVVPDTLFYIKTSVHHFIIHIVCLFFLQKKPPKPQNKFAGLLKIWFAMQKIFCGEDHEIPKKKLKHFKDVKGLDGISQQDLSKWL